MINEQIERRFLFDLEMGRFKEYKYIFMNEIYFGNFNNSFRNNAKLMNLVKNLGFNSGKFGGYQYNYVPYENAILYLIRDKKYFGFINPKNEIAYGRKLVLDKMNPIPEYILEYNIERKT